MNISPIDLFLNKVKVGCKGQRLIVVSSPTLCALPDTVCVEQVGLLPGNKNVT